MDAYLNRQDAVMRLDGTICKFEDDPVYVEFHGEDDPHKVHISYFDGSGRRSKTVKYTSPDFTYHPINLGYININNNAYYLSRSPVRRQKQGLARDSIRILPHPRGLHGSFHYFPSIELSKTIKGDYPSLKKAIKSIERGKVKGIAVDRDVAFRESDMDLFSILFKERIVGHYNVNTQTVTWENNEMTSIIFRILERKGLGALYSGSL